MSLAAVCGCGSRPTTYAVGGTVFFADGTPLAGGMVEFLGSAAGKPINARGLIAQDGTFTLGTFRDGDGAVAGEHQAIVVGPPIFPSGDITKLQRKESVSQRFNGYATSGLRFTVTPEGNRFAITVDREQ